MSTSLKGYIPALSRLLGLSPAALYERQRALVRSGLMAPEGGRGRGGGVRATAPAVALLLLSVLATDRLSEVDRVGPLAAARPAGGKRCPCTGTKSFLDALASLLVATGKAAGVIEIVVSRTADRTMIRYWDDAGEPAVSEFRGTAKVEPGLSVAATLSHKLWQQIAQDVQSMVLEKFVAETEGV